ncbi:sugar ABC transporter permease [Neobacillus sp. DY30]|uniref:carbohydrate ABC transporter permease n=1 Tax=Neobacillus sp. DY30 TaxID=3047871 RepID=UPI0024BF169E|nr:sugar ABC transporter permease [Neobacillus sp. DY30]WHY01929.1 sugar ABC transporter permease [Neobacillus sp. DY30]
MEQFPEVTSKQAKVRIDNEVIYFSIKESRWKLIKKNVNSYILLLPFLLIYSIFTLYPVAKGFFVSFYDWKILGDKTFIGLQNYIKVLTDPIFFSSLWHTLLFVVLSTPVIVLVGFILALIVHQPLKGQVIFRLIFFMPMVLAVSVVASVWEAVLDNYSGMVNSLLKVIGVKNDILWLGDPVLAWISIIGITLWWTVGFNMVIYLAGLQDISDELYEAAKIDGASPWDRLKHITIPSLKRVTLLVVFLQIIASFKIFSQVYLVTQGGPAGSTRTIIQYIYEEGFQKYQFGTASAMSYLFFLVLLIWSFIQFRLQNKED